MNMKTMIMLCLLVLGSAAPGFAYDRNDTPENNVAPFSRLILDIQDIRRMGSAALDLCYVAAGRQEAHWELGLKPWDIAAGALLVQEAGGLISDFDGGNDWMESGRIVAANPKCLKAMLQVIRPALGSAA